MTLNSVLGKNWISKKYNEEIVNTLKDNLNLSEILSRLIAIRKININEVNLYLNPKLKNSMPDPFTLKDMDKSVDRVSKAIINKEKIGIFGDYDVDGATSTAILGNYFNDIGSKISIYIPDRRTEGYGPTNIGFDKLIKEGSNIIFTVDCGTMSFDTINTYQKKNYDIIILDHHQSELKLPNAHSIINPNRFDRHLYASTRLPLSYLNISLSKFFFVFLSHNLQLSGLISSASINLFSLSLTVFPNSILKSISSILILVNKLTKCSLIISALFFRSSNSDLLTQPSSTIKSSFMSGSFNSSFFKNNSINGFLNLYSLDKLYLFIIEPNAKFLITNSIGIILTFFISCSLEFTLLMK